MGSINRVSPDPASAHEQLASERPDARRGLANPSQHQQIPDQNKEMQTGNVTAPQKVSDELKKSAIDVREEQPHQARRRNSRLDKHA